MRWLLTLPPDPSAASTKSAASGAATVIDPHRVVAGQGLLRSAHADTAGPGDDGGHAEVALESSDGGGLGGLYRPGGDQAGEGGLDDGDLAE